MQLRGRIKSLVDVFYLSSNQPAKKSNMQLDQRRSIAIMGAEVAIYQYYGWYMDGGELGYRFCIGVEELQVAPLVNNQKI